MMQSLQVLILDRDDRPGGRMESICAVLAQLFAPQLEIHRHRAGDAGWEPTLRQLRKHTIAFVHWNDKGRLDDEKVKAAVGQATVRVAYSGGGLDERSVTPPGWFTVRRPLLTASDLSVGEWRELVEWATRSDLRTQPEALPRALRLDFPRVAVALLILSQGFIALTSGSVIGADPGELQRVFSREWWASPFQGQDLWGRLRGELGVPESGDLSTELEQFVSWLASKESPPAEIDLRSLVPLVELTLATKLDVRSIAQ